MRKNLRARGLAVVAATAALAGAGAFAAVATTGHSATNLRVGAAPVAARGVSAAAAASSGTASVVNRSTASTASYWTADRMAAAKPLVATRTLPAPASYGTANLDFTRSRITPQTANKSAPYKAVGKLFFTIPGQGNYVCSGSVIAKRLVVTAAHCMYTDGVGFHTNWLFIPGYDGTKSGAASQPFGAWNWTRGEVSTNWINSHGALPNNDDFGILVEQDQSFNGGKAIPIYKKTGMLDTAVGHLFDTHVTMLGYPCNLDSCLIMQRVDSSDHRPGSTASGNNAYEYGSDMTGGSSGGPWVENFGDPGSAAPSGGFNTRNAVIGVTSYVYNDAAVLVEGASSFNSNFTTIRTDSCNAGSGNC